MILVKRSQSYKKFFILESKQKKRIKKNIFSGISSEMTQILTQIFFTPLMIYFWGIENFGIWIFLLSKNGISSPLSDYKLFQYLHCPYIRKPSYSENFNLC